MIYILLCCSAHRVKPIAVYTPRSYVGGHKTDELWIEVGDYLLAVLRYDLGAAPYFDASHLTWLRRVVNHEGHAPGARGVAELLALAHAVTAYVYRVQFRVVAEASGHDMRLACGVHCSYSPQALACAVFDFCGGEDAHSMYILSDYKPLCR